MYPDYCYAADVSTFIEKLSFSGLTIRMKVRVSRISRLHQDNLNEETNCGKLKAFPENAWKVQDLSE